MAARLVLSSALLLLLSGCGLGLLPTAGGGSDSGLLTTLPGDGGGVNTTGGDGGGGDGGGSAGDGGGGSGDGGGTSGDGGGTSGDGGSSASAPTLSSLSITEGPNRIEVSFVATDPDDDLEGGKLKITQGGSTSSFNISSQIDQWRPSGSSLLYLDLANCDRGSHLSFEVTAVDAAGHSSASRTDSLTPSGNATALREVGDTPADIEAAGVVSRNSYLCGDLYSTGNDGVNYYTGDLDIISFHPSTGGTYTFSLFWDAVSGDYDLHLYSSTWSSLAAAADFGTAQPESFSATLLSGTTYYLVVAGWSGSTGGYEIDVQ